MEITLIFKIAGIGILVAVIVYVFAVLMTKAITKKDFLMLPKGEKIAEILEKLHLLR